MTKWLQSGRRRDLCVFLAAEEGLTGQKLKTRLERHYDERIEPKSFYGALSALVDSGFVEKGADGLADVYALTDAGERRVRKQYEWMSAMLDESG